MTEIAFSYNDPMLGYDADWLLPEFEDTDKEESLSYKNLSSPDNSAQKEHSRKRQRSNYDNAEASEYIRKAIMEGLRELNLDPKSAEGKMKTKQIRNKLSAQLHRDNKKNYIESLEMEANEYKAQIASLRATVQSLSEENQRLKAIIGSSSLPSAPVGANIGGASFNLPSNSILLGGPHESVPVIPYDIFESDLPLLQELSGDLPLNACSSPINVPSPTDFLSDCASVSESCGHTSNGYSSSDYDDDTESLSPLSPASNYSQSSSRKRNASIAMFSFMLLFSFSFWSSPFMPWLKSSGSSLVSHSEIEKFAELFTGKSHSQTFSASDFKIDEDVLDVLMEESPREAVKPAAVVGKVFVQDDTKATMSYEELFEAYMSLLTFVRNHIMKDGGSSLPVTNLIFQEEPSAHSMWSFPQSEVINLYPAPVTTVTAEPPRVEKKHLRSEPPSDPNKALIPSHYYNRYYDELAVMMELFKEIQAKEKLPVKEESNREISPLVITSEPGYSRILVTDGKGILNPGLLLGSPDASVGLLRDSESVVVPTQRMKLLIPADYVQWGSVWDGVGDSSISTASVVKALTRKGEGSGHSDNKTEDDEGFDVGDTQEMWLELSCNILQAKLVKDVVTHI